MRRLLLALVCLLSSIGTLSLRAERVLETESGRPPAPEGWQPEPREPQEPQAPAVNPFQADLDAALADIEKLPADQRPYVRYLTLYALRPSERDEAVRTCVFQLNSLSRYAKLVTTLQLLCTTGLLRVDIRDFGWKREVYEKLAELDPYHHIKGKVAPVVLVPVPVAPVVAAIAVNVGTEVIASQATTACRDEAMTQVVGQIGAGTKFTVSEARGDVLRVNSSSHGDLWVSKGDFRAVEQAVAAQAAAPAPVVPASLPANKAISAAAPWLDKDRISKLIAYTQSQAPLLRADWFFVQSARQVDRKNKETGAGYYDFLGLKTEADLENLAGLDRKKAREIQREVAAVVESSGVALNNRQIFRFGATSGGYWETIDAEASEDRKNAVRLLDGDFKGDAKEVYAVLPNRLFFYGAVNIADGKLQATVPDKIAADRNSTSNDLRIHTAKNCITCHVEGLRPIEDYTRSFYAAPPGDARLQSVDYDKLKRLEALYLTPMEDDYDADQIVYARALKRLTGFKPAELARAYARVWSKWAEAPVSAEQFALELGVTEEEMKRKFAAYARAFGSLDPILVGYLKRPAFKARREHIEEVYILAQSALMGVQLAEAAQLPQNGGKR